MCKDAGATFSFFPSVKAWDLISVPIFGGYRSLNKITNCGLDGQV
jgi:hypothetical protein